MTTVDVNGVALGIESFGDDSAPLVLLVGGTTMLSWPDALFPVGNGEAIARGIPEARLLVLEDAAVAIPEGSRELSRRHVAVVGDGAKPQLGDQFEIVGPLPLGSALLGVSRRALAGRLRLSAADGLRGSVVGGRPRNRGDSDH